MSDGWTEVNFKTAGKIVLPLSLSFRIIPILTSFGVI